MHLWMSSIHACFRRRRYTDITGSNSGQSPKIHQLQAVKFYSVKCALSMKQHYVEKQTRGMAEGRGGWRENPRLYFAENAASCLRQHKRHIWSKSAWILSLSTVRSEVRAEHRGLSQRHFIRVNYWWLKPNLCELPASPKENIPSYRFTVCTS